jgi:SAM-dependent methyltransferase
MASQYGTSQAVRIAMDWSERIVFGGRAREYIAKKTLAALYRSRFRRQWKWQVAGEPHFTDHSVELFRLFTGDVDQSVYSIMRGLLSGDAVSEGDVVLDIGCGDGGFTRRFLAPKASHVEALDIDPLAITWAQANNSAANITYLLRDAVRSDFPRSRYDLVVLDGALGHIAPQDSQILLDKVTGAVGRTGVFVGSESLGPEGSDHLQFFDSPDDLRLLLGKHFAVVRLKMTCYKINHGAYLRTEAYWRCCQNPALLERKCWS